MRIWLGLLLCVLPPCFVGVDASVAGLQPPRDFGYFIGDVIEQRVRLQAHGTEVELAELPLSERTGLWLERLSSLRTTGDRGQHWLVLKYQVINAPRALIRISLPGLSLAAIDAEPLVVEPRPISISPLTPDTLVAGAGSLPIRPDRQPVPPDTRAAARRLQYSGMAMIATIILWLGWWLWRQRSDARQLPFARAFFDLRKLDSQQVNDNPQAWVALHHAFNDAAGKTISRESIVDLIDDTGWLASFEPRINDFYAASASRFFANTTSPQAFAVIEFSKALYRAEKSQTGGLRQARR